jgi:hypothetical protein
VQEGVLQVEMNKIGEFCKVGGRAYFETEVTGFKIGSITGRGYFKEKNNQHVD